MFQGMASSSIPKQDAFNPSLISILFTEKKKKELAYILKHNLLR